MNFLFVAIGGVIGGISRYQMGKMISGRSKSLVPIGTLAVNISGAVLLGIVNGLSVAGNTYLLGVEGFLGAFTTFSTFMYEGFNLYGENERKNAVVYILVTLILGITGYIIGLVLCKAISVRIFGGV